MRKMKKDAKCLDCGAELAEVKVDYNGDYFCPICDSRNLYLKDPFQKEKLDELKKARGIVPKDKEKMIVKEYRMIAKIDSSKLDPKEINGFLLKRFFNISFNRKGIEIIKLIENRREPRRKNP